jgi:hypothetical protein
MTMATRTNRSTKSIAGACVAIGLSVLLIGCGSSQASASASAQPVPSVVPSAQLVPDGVPSASELPTPAASESALPVESASALPSAAPTAPPVVVSDLYVRMWFVNASIGPSNYFFSDTVISGGKLYYMPDRPDTGVVPLYLSPMSATISPAGLGTLASTIAGDGLLGATHDFVCAHDPEAGAMAGTGMTYVQIVTHGVTHDLTGSCPYGTAARIAAIPAPGTYDAFEDLVAHLQNMTGWLGDQLGKPGPWDPAKLVVLADVPAEAFWDLTGSGTAPWLGVTWTNFGKLVDPANVQERCGVLAGAELAKLLPSIKQAHSGTLFVDSAKTQRVLAVRPLMPNEPPPSFCV